jgi:hypothetical protein
MDPWSGYAPPDCKNKKGPAMVFTPAELHDLPGVISAPRFATYLQATGNDRARALALYEWNLDLSAAFIVPLQICEIAVRNGVAEAIEDGPRCHMALVERFLAESAASKTGN